MPTTTMGSKSLRVGPGRKALSLRRPAARTECSVAESCNKKVEEKLPISTNNELAKEGRKKTQTKHSPQTAPRLSEYLHVHNAKVLVPERFVQVEDVHVAMDRYGGDLCVGQHEADGVEQNEIKAYQQMLALLMNLFSPLVVGTSWGNGINGGKERRGSCRTRNRLYRMMGSRS